MDDSSTLRDSFCRSKGDIFVPAALCSTGNLILLISSCEAAFNCFPACSSSVEVEWEVLSSCRCPLTPLCWWQDNMSTETGTMELFYTAPGTHCSTLCRASKGSRLPNIRTVCFVFFSHQMPGEMPLFEVLSCRVELKCELKVVVDVFEYNGN